MATILTNCQCPACTGPLRFSADSGRLECDYCGQSYSVGEIDAPHAEKDALAAAATPPEGLDTKESFDSADNEQAASEGAPKRKKSQWDFTEIGAEWGADAQAVAVYSCPSCGAELIVEATTAATSCPYCGNNAIVPGKLGGALKPDFIIPFKLKKDAAIAALKRHYRKRIFLPGSFSGGNQLKKIQGIYVPFWLFNAKTAADCGYAATKIKRCRKGDYKITETSHYDVHRAGTVAFQNIPADASKRCPTTLWTASSPIIMRSSRPFPRRICPGIWRTSTMWA